MVIPVMRFVTEPGTILQADPAVYSAAWVKTASEAGGDARPTDAKPFQQGRIGLNANSRPRR